MKIKLAEHSGFCIGVCKAVIRAVKEINSQDEDILIKGQLIHNPQTSRILESRALKVIDDYRTIDGKVIAVRTHGIPAEHLNELKKRSKKVINLICSKVAHVHPIVKRYLA